MGFSSLAVMANSLLLQFEGRPPWLPSRPTAVPSQQAAAPAAATEEKQLLVAGQQAGQGGAGGSGGTAGQVSPA